MNQKIVLMLLLFLLQIIFNRYVDFLRLNLDLLFLILVFISIKSSFGKSIVAGTVIGLITDFFSVNIMGVFGFSRTLAAYLLNELSRRIDLKNNILVFLLVAISLATSNVIANIFFFFILGFQFNISLLLYQPLLTGLFGIMTLSVLPRKYIDVY